MKKTYIYVAAALFSVAMQAQNLDPTVEVSRVYEGKLIEVRKPVMDMAVPDTLYRFDLDFDYSVFDNPYRGSYEFNPYILDMRPEADMQKPTRLYMRAGAGYTLHPLFDILWSPDLKGAFGMDLRGSHRSYVGKYRSVGGNEEFDGYDLLSKAGLDFGYDWKKAGLDFGASYYGIAVKDLFGSRAYNALDAYVSLKSKMSQGSRFGYEVDLAYRYAEESSSLHEHDFSADVSLGPDFGGKGKMSFDLGGALNVYSGALSTVLARMYLVPRYICGKGAFHADLGFRVSAAMMSGGFGRNQIIYPAIKIHVAAIPDAMRIYLNVGGGEKLNSYASLIDRNHHLNIGYGISSASCLVCPGIERVSAQFGMEGRISGFFSYNLRGGYVNNAYAPLDAVQSAGDGRYLPHIGYSSYQKAYAALDWDLYFQSVRFDGTVEYTYAWGMEQPYLIMPASFTADAELVYNWRKRIYAGIDGIFSSARKSVDNSFEVPFYVDLGVYAEYAFNGNVSLWLRGGNLLNMEIQRNLLFAERGVNVTAGISLKF